MIDIPAQIYPRRSIIASMDIPVVSNQAKQLTGQPVSAATLFEQLAQSGSIQARVMSISHGQAVLNSQLGQILTSGSPDLKVGDRLNIRLDSSSQPPSLKIDNINRSPVTLELSRNKALADLFSGIRLAHAVVKKQNQSATTIETLSRPVRLEPLPEFKTGQLLKMVKSSGGGAVEIYPVDHQQVLKSTISNLIPVQKNGTTASALFQLARLIRSSVSIDKKFTSEPLDTLLKLLPESNNVNKTTISRWIGFTLNATGDKTAQSSTLQNPFKVIQQLIQHNSIAVEQLKHLSKQAGSESDRSGDQLANHDLLQSFVRELIKLGEQSLNQQLFQQASLRLQQDQQQPVLLHLSIPLNDNDKLSELDLKIRQHTPDTDADNQIWDIHLDFELGQLGQISTHLSLSGKTVSASFWSEKIETQQKIESSIDEFQTGISRAGLIPGQLLSFHGKPPQQTGIDIPAIPDMLIDVRV